MRFPSLVILSTFGIAIFGSSRLLAAPAIQSFVYSSDDMPGGGSYLGVDTCDVMPERLAALKLKEERGVEVSMVDQDAPAGKAGLKEHDVILSVNDTPVESVEQLRRLIHEIPAGRVISLGLSRDGQTMTLKVQLGERSKAFGFPASGKEFKFVMPRIADLPNIPDIESPVSVVVVHSSTRSGLMVENLTPQLGDFFGVKEGRGVLVRSVEKGSRAEKAGFRAGDVIVRVNDEGVSDSGDFSHAVRKRKDNKASVAVVRNRKEQTLTLTLPESGPQSELEDESFEMPEISVETRRELSQVKEEMARMRPQLEQAMAQYRESLETQEAMEPRWKAPDHVQRKLQKQRHRHQADI